METLLAYGIIVESEKTKAVNKRYFESLSEQEKKFAYLNIDAGSYSLMNQMTKDYFGRLDVNDPEFIEQFIEDLDDDAFGEYIQKTYPLLEAWIIDDEHQAIIIEGSCEQVYNYSTADLSRVTPEALAQLVRAMREVSDGTEPQWIVWHNDL